MKGARSFSVYLFNRFKIQDYFIISSEKLKLSYQRHLYCFLSDLIVFKSRRYQNSREDIKTELVVERRAMFLWIVCKRNDHSSTLPDIQLQYSKQDQQAIFSFHLSSFTCQSVCLEKKKVWPDKTKSHVGFALSCSNQRSFEPFVCCVKMRLRYSLAVPVQLKARMWTEDRWWTTLPVAARCPSPCPTSSLISAAGTVLFAHGFLSNQSEWSPPPSPPHPSPRPPITAF